jgi:hypothetical protein
MLAYSTSNQLWDADAAVTNPDAACIRKHTTVSAATHTTLAVERLVDKHRARKAAARRAEVVANAAAATDSYHAARAVGDQAAAERAVAELGVWFTVAQAYGATPADINAARAGGAR